MPTKPQSRQPPSEVPASGDLSESVAKHLTFIASSVEPTAIEQLEIVSLLLIVSTALQDRNHRLAAASGLDVQDMFLLYSIGAGGRDQPVSPRHLADVFSLNAATISKRLARIEKQALITRALADHDKRKVVIMLTAAGRKLYQRIRASENAPEYTFDWISRELNAAERQQLTSILRRLVRAAGQHR